MDICEFSQTLMLAKTIKSSGLMNKEMFPTNSLKDVANTLGFPQSRINRKQIAKQIVNYVKNNCVCLSDISEPKCKAFDF